MAYPASPYIEERNGGLYVAGTDVSLDSVVIRFQQGDSDIIAGLRSREPAIDILDVKTAGLRRASDPALLALAAKQDRILITHDRRTMTYYAGERLAAGELNAGSIRCEPNGVGRVVRRCHKL